MASDASLTSRGTNGGVTHRRRVSNANIHEKTRRRLDTGLFLLPHRLLERRPCAEPSSGSGAPILDTTAVGDDFMRDDTSSGGSGVGGSSEPGRCSVPDPEHELRRRDVRG